MESYSEEVQDVLSKLSSKWYKNSISLLELKRKWSIQKEDIELIKMKTTDTVDHTCCDDECTEVISSIIKNLKSANQYCNSCKTKRGIVLKRSPEQIQSELIEIYNNNKIITPYDKFIKLGAKQKFEFICECGNTEKRNLCTFNGKCGACNKIEGDLISGKTRKDRRKQSDQSHLFLVDKNRCKKCHRIVSGQEVTKARDGEYSCSICDFLEETKLEFDRPMDSVLNGFVKSQNLIRYYGRALTLDDFFDFNRNPKTLVEKEKMSDWNWRLHILQDTITECGYCGKQTINDEFCSKDCSLKGARRAPMNNRIKNIIEDNECELLTKSEFKSHDNIEIKCKCGNSFIRKVHTIKRYETDRNLLCIPCSNVINQCKTSRYETEISSIFPSFKRNQYILPGGRELDLVDESGLAIEFNGIYYHTEEFKGINDHLRKTEDAEELGYQLFHINENEWNNNKDLWISMINNKLNENNKIFARKCEVREIEAKEAREFLEENHLQGYSSAKVKVGLYYNNELVSVMTFGKPRMNNNYEWELIRFSSKKNTSVIGGAGKLLKYFERKYQPKSLISYANRRWSQGNVYKKLGFEFSHKTGPGYQYFKGQIPHSRQKFWKENIHNMLDFDESKSIKDNIYDAGYRKLYDSGNLVFYKDYK